MEVDMAAATGAVMGAATEVVTRLVMGAGIAPDMAAGWVTS